MQGRPEFYILPIEDGVVSHIPVPADLLTWAQWNEEHHTDKIVQQDTIGDYWVSTVFLGFDHNWVDDGPPLIFETMVFEGPQGDRSDISCQRYSTWEMALEGHRRTALLLKMGQLPKQEDDD